MKGNFEQSLALVLKDEGGHVNHPADPGGETNMGVTKKVWEDWTGKPIAPGGMKSLTIADVTRDVARRAAQLRARFGIRPADALQIGASLVHGATGLVTNDRRLRRLACAVDVIVLDEYVVA